MADTSDQHEREGRRPGPQVEETLCETCQGNQYHCECPEPPFMLRPATVDLGDRIFGPPDEQRPRSLGYVWGDLHLWDDE